MVPNITDWTVVMVGQWNPAIFSPEWVARKILNTETIETELAVGPTTTNVRYSTDKLLVIPQQDRLIIASRNTEEVSLLEMESRSRTVLQLLSHTPIRALGINFGFIESNPPVEMVRTFDLSDSGALSDAGSIVKATTLIREIEIPAAILKLKMRLSGGAIHFHFNFTHPVASAQEAGDILNGKVIEYRNSAVRMLDRVFNLQTEGVA
jgi:hypothetical protein